MKFPVLFFVFFVFFLFFILTCTTQTAFRHVTTASNTTRNITLIDDSHVKNESRFISSVWGKKIEAFSCSNYALNAGVKHNQSKKQWEIVQKDENKNILIDLAFNALSVYRPTSYCFFVTGNQAAKTSNGFPNGMVINNPATNNNHYVLLLVNQNFNKEYKDNSQLISYHNGRWSISKNIDFFPAC